LQLNMPQLVRDYGAYRQFDIVTTVDQETFLRSKKHALVSGFSIDEKGRIVATLNTVSYMKVAPKTLIAKDLTKAAKNDDDDEEMFSEYSDEFR
jgi:hypothetical protein